MFPPRGFCKKSYLRHTKSFCSSCQGLRLESVYLLGLCVHRLRAWAEFFIGKQPWGTKSRTHTRARTRLHACGGLHNTVGHEGSLFLRHGDAVGGKCSPCCWYGVTSSAEMISPLSLWSLIKAINKQFIGWSFFLWFNLQLPSCSFTHTNSQTTKPHHRKFTSQVPPMPHPNTHTHTHTLSGMWTITDFINHTSQSELAMRCSLVHTH